MVKLFFWVEGKADQKFIGDLLDVWFNLKVDNNFRCDDPTKKIKIEIVDMGGIGELQKKDEIFALKDAEGFKNIIIIDADNINDQRSKLNEFKKECKVDLSFFLLPNDAIDGALEDLLEQIINPANQPIFDCWQNYEQCIGRFTNPVRPGSTYTTPAKKSKIYGYLEALVGETTREKELIKETKRNYKNSDHWVLDTSLKPILIPLKDFLTQHINPSI